MSLLLALLLSQTPAPVVVQDPFTTKKARVVDCTGSTQCLNVKVVEQPAGGAGLTNAELRATPVPVSGSFSDGGHGTVYVLGSVAVTGPLTDAQLRAVAVPVSGTFWQATQPVSGTFWQATQPVSGTLTCNAGTNLNTSALALDATLTGGAAKTIVRGGAKGTTVAADVTSTANGADRQGLDVQLQNASIAVTGPLTDAQLRAVPVPVSGTVTTSPPANASTNVAQFGGTAVVTGTGVGGLGIPRVTISSDSSLAANQSVNVAQVNGVATSTGVGASGTGTQRNACLVHDGTTVAGVIAATTALKTDLSSVAGTATSVGYGAAGAGVQRVRTTQEATYSAGTTVKTATAAGVGPWFTICGSATKTIRVQKFWATATVATAAVYADIVLKKTSTATSAGTATALVKAPHDSTSAASTANAVNFYTVLATAGTSVGVVCNNMIFSPITATVANFTHPSIVCDWTGKDESEGIVLRGIAQCLEANFGTTTTNAPTIHLHVSWTET